MHPPWFKRIGILFVPINASGWVVLLAGIVYAIYLFIDIDSRSHSVSDTLMNWVFNLMVIAVVYSVIAFLTSRSAKKN